MKLILNENESLEEREIKIIKAWQSMGNELQVIIDQSEIIPSGIKNKITKSICHQYAKEIVEDFVSSFAYEEFDIIFDEFDESDAFKLAEIIANLPDEKYNKIKEQSEISVKKSQEKLNKSTKKSETSSEPGDKE